MTDSSQKYFEEPAEEPAEHILDVEFNDSLRKHSQRVDRLSTHKSRNLEAYNYIESHPFDHILNSKQIDKLYNCHSWILFRNYYNINEVKLHEAHHCDMHLLCPLCAIRRASKKLQVYYDKTEQLIEKHQNLRMYHCVLTILNSDNLEERYNHIKKSIGRIMSRRRDALKAKKGNRNCQYAINSMFSNVIAGVYSVEVKVGKNSKKWHPHIHLILLSSSEIDYSSAIKEWKDITRDSTNIRFIPILKAGMKEAFLETFKYALKFSEMKIENNLYAYEVLRGKRLLGSFGEYRGLDKIEIDDSKYDLEEFLELMYLFKEDKYYSSDDLMID